MQFYSTLALITRPPDGVLLAVGARCSAPAAIRLVAGAVIRRRFVIVH